MIPGISVIMPVFCGEAFVAEAIRSILAQTPTVAEIIVVDDGSTDATAAIVQSFGTPVRYVHQANRGAQHARNRGLEEARGELIAFLDADDLWHADKLATQLPLMRDADVAIGRTLIHDDPDSIAFLLPSLCPALFRRSAFDRVGRLDPDLPFSDDLDWYLRAREKGLAIAFHPEVVLYHRRHDANMTRDTEAKQRFHLMALHKSMVRRRRRGLPQISAFPPPMTEACGKTAR